MIPGISEVLSSVMEKYTIRETRLPVEILQHCDYMEEKRLQFYQEVSTQAETCKPLYRKHHIR